MIDINNPPLVTVIITVKDRFEWFRECLISVLEQEYRSLEIIIVDDGSSIAAADFLRGKAIDTSGMKIIRNEISSGPGVAREMGRKEAGGGFVNYLDSDDICLPKKITSQVDYLLHHPHVGMCYCLSAAFTEMPISGQEPSWHPIDHPVERILPQILIDRPWGTSSCLWTKEAVNQIGAWQALWIGEDIEYEFRAGCKGIEIATIPEVLCYIRRSRSETQLSNESPWRQRHFAYFLSALARDTAIFRDVVEPEVTLSVGKKIVDYAILWLTCDQKSLAIESLQALGPITGKNITKRGMYYLFTVILTLCPGDMALRIIRRLRRNIPEFIGGGKFIS